MNMQKLILVSRPPEIRGGVIDLVEKDFTYKFLNGQKLIARMFTPLKEEEYMHFFVGVSDLTSAEITDIEESWREIEEGQSETFTNVNEFLDELKR